MDYLIKLLNKKFEGLKMKNKKIKRKLKELKTFLLALNAYGNLDQETHVMI